MSLLNILIERTNKTDRSYPYRVYKKSIEFYRIEQRSGSTWTEIHQDKDIKFVELQDCNIVVEEEGRQKTLEMTGADSKDVPVHAWVECKEFLIMEQPPELPNNVLFYNPYVVTQFMDRAKLENKTNPVFEAIFKCDKVAIDGNKLYYEGATDTDVSVDYMDNNMHLLKK